MNNKSSRKEAPEKKQEQSSKQLNHTINVERSNKQDISILGSTNYQTKYFPKINFYDEKADVLWNKQMNRIMSERKLLTRNQENSSQDLQKTFFQGNIFFKKDVSLLNTSTNKTIINDRNTSYNTLELGNKTMSKDRLRDFHSEHVMYLGNSKGYQNAYKKATTQFKTSNNTIVNKTFSAPTNIEIKLPDAKKEKNEEKSNLTNNSTIGGSKKGVRVINLNVDPKIKSNIKSNANTKTTLDKITYDNKSTIENGNENNEIKQSNSNEKSKTTFNKLVQKGKEMSVKKTENTAKTVTIDLDDLENTNSRPNRKISPMHLKLYESSCFNSQYIKKAEIPNSHPSYNKNVEKNKKLDPAFSKKLGNLLTSKLVKLESKSDKRLHSPAFQKKLGNLSSNIVIK